MKKETILQEFDRIFGTNKAYIVKQGLVNSNESQLTLNNIRNFLSKKLNQVRKEEREKIEDILEKDRLEPNGKTLKERLIEFKDNLK